MKNLSYSLNLARRLERLEHQYAQARLARTAPQIVISFDSIGPDGKCVRGQEEYVLDEKGCLTPYFGQHRDTRL
jgi:hypothetical protein